MLVRLASLIWLLAALLSLFLTIAMMPYKNWGSISSVGHMNTTYGTTGNMNNWIYYSPTTSIVVDIRGRVTVDTTIDYSGSANPPPPPFTKCSLDYDVYRGKASGNSYQDCEAFLPVISGSKCSKMCDGVPSHYQKNCVRFKTVVCAASQAMLGLGITSCLALVTGVGTSLFILIKGSSDGPTVSLRRASLTGTICCCLAAIFMLGAVAEYGAYIQRLDDDSFTAPLIDLLKRLVPTPRGLNIQSVIDAAASVKYNHGYQIAIASFVFCCVSAVSSAVTARAVLGSAGGDNRAPLL